MFAIFDLIRKLTNLRRLSVVVSGLLTLMVGACDHGAYIYVEVSPPIQLSHEAIKTDVESAAKLAGLVRTHDWFCDTAPKSNACTEGAELATWFQGQGQIISFDLIKGKYVFHFGGVPAYVASPTKKDFQRLADVFSKKYGAQAVREAEGTEP